MKIVVCILIFVALVIFFFLWYVFDVAFYNPKYKRNKKGKGVLGEQYAAVSDKLKELHDGIKEEKYENVEITAYDGLRLKGKYYHFRDGAPTEIIFHGYRSSSNSDCGGGFRLSKASGCNILLPDHRAHGKSQGNVITFGIKERFDCVKWVEYIVQRNRNTDIFISGVSMGAATVLMASDLELPENVKGIIADSPFSSPEEIILSESKKMGFSEKIALPFIRMSARIFAGIELNKITAINSVKNAKVPILIIHGEDDRFVPCEMGKRVFEAANSKKMLLTVKGAGHGLSYLIDESSYEEAVNKFKKAALNEDKFE
jgi:fermentation-respiration switch protein FrsA (DUF1100 family)